MHRGLVRPEDAKKAKALTKSKSILIDEANEEGNSAAQKTQTVSAALARQLSAHRTAAMQAELGRQPNVALIAVVHQLAIKALSHGWHERSNLKINCTTQTGLDRFAPGIEESSAAKSLGELRNAWLAR